MAQFKKTVAYDPAKDGIEIAIKISRLKRNSLGFSEKILYRLRQKYVWIEDNSSPTGCIFSDHNPLGAAQGCCNESPLGLCEADIHPF